MNRRMFLQSSAATVSLAFLASQIGCGKASQQTLAALAQTIGTSVSNLASLLGQTALATKITSITTQLVADIQGYVKGGATATIIQLIGDLEQAINLIPVTTPIAALIDLALGTIQAILAQFPSAAGAVQARAVGVRQVKLAKVPKTKSDYIAQWKSVAPPTYADAAQ